MRTLTTIIVFINLAVSGQETKTYYGKVVDSLTREPIAFAYIIADNEKLVNFSDFDGKITVSDLDGNFKLQLPSDYSMFLTTNAIGYKIKIQKISDLDGQMVIELVTDSFDLDIKLKITGKPLDTVFYKGGQIETINYQYREQITFYESGRIKSKTAGQSTRQWYENGNLKYQSILYSSHSRSVTEWYENGQVKAHGFIYWAYNEKTKEGDWFKNDNWTYWDKNGKKIKNE